MLRALTGKICEIFENALIIDVNGLGFEVMCSRSVFDSCKIGEVSRLVTSLQISESGANLYGFASEREREFFLKLMSVKGVGGRTAIAILSELSIDEVIEAVSSADFSVFQRVSGIGRKTAERLCFELKNLSMFKNPDTKISDTPQKSQAANSGSAKSVMEALMSLGFSQADAARTINSIRAAHSENFANLGEEDLLRLALRELHGR